MQVASVAPAQRIVDLTDRLTKSQDRPQEQGQEGWEKEGPLIDGWGPLDFMDDIGSNEDRRREHAGDIETNEKNQVLVSGLGFGVWRRVQDLNLRFQAYEACEIGQTSLTRHSM